MAATKTRAGIPNFALLNPAVYIHEPSSTASSGGPDLVLLAGWVDASTRNIAKYTAGYEQLYPSARIVVVLTKTADMVFRSKGANLNRIAPVLEALYALPSDGKLLVHSFSNGGATTMCLIANTFLANTSHQLPLTALILDSAPGKSTYKATIRALAIGAPKFFLSRWLFLATITVFFWVLRVLRLLRLRRDMIQAMREQLNNPTLFRPEAPRLYIYSETDHIIHWKEIDEHMGEAKGSGYKVDAEKFVGTAHVGHLKGNDEHYWSCVKRVWDEAI